MLKPRLCFLFVLLVLAGTTVYAGGAPSPQPAAPVTAPRFAQPVAALGTAPTSAPVLTVQPPAVGNSAPLAVTPTLQHLPSATPRSNRENRAGRLLPGSVRQTLATVAQVRSALKARKSTTGARMSLSTGDILCLVGFLCAVLIGWSVIGAVAAIVLYLIGKDDTTDDIWRILGLIGFILGIVMLVVSLIWFIGYGSPFWWGRGRRNGWD